MTLLGDGKCRGTCVHVKVLERYPVVRIRPLQDGLKHHKVIPGDEATLVRVRDAEEGRELRPADLAEVALGRDGFDELLAVQEPAAPTRNGHGTRRDAESERPKGHNAARSGESSTHFWPSTTVLAFVSNDLLQRLSSFSGTEIGRAHV